MKTKRSFKVVLSIILVLMILIPLLTVTYITMNTSQKMTTQMIFDRNMDLALSVQNEIEVILSDAEAIMSILANTDVVKNMNSWEMDSLLTQTVWDYPFISQIYTMDESGMQIYKTSGTLADRSDREYFQKAIKGETNYSDVFLSGSTHKPIVTIALPIEKQGKVVGVLGASLDLNKLSEVVAKVQTGDSGYAYIVEGNGKLIAHPDEKLVEEMKDVSDLKPVMEVINGNTDIGEYSYEGESKLASYVPVENVNWGIVVQLPAKEAYREAEAQKNFFLTVLIGSAIIALVISIVIAGYITVPINILTEKMALAEAGDLSAKVTGKILNRKDEFGALANGFNKMLDGNKNIVDRIIDSAKSLTNSAESLSEIVQQNSAAMQEVASGTNQLAISSSNDSKDTKDGANALKELARGAENVASNAERLNGIVMKNTEVAKSGVEMMDVTSDSIESTFKLSEDINVKMNSLEKSADKISNILETIVDIAEQTNLLALNAAIEAARAGEAGKGFAVVAEEIRKLAEESSASAESITGILYGIQSEVKGTSDIFKETNSRLNKVVRESADTKKQIETIAHNSSEALTAVEEIAAVSEQQAASSQELTALMDRLLNSINDTAATAEEISASTEQQTASTEQIGEMADELSKMAKEFENIIKHFKL